FREQSSLFFAGDEIRLIHQARRQALQNSKQLALFHSRLLLRERPAPVPFGGSRLTKASTSNLRFRISDPRWAFVQFHVFRFPACNSYAGMLSAHTSMIGLLSAPVPVAE